MGRETFFGGTSSKSLVSKEKENIKKTKKTHIHIPPQGEEKTVCSSQALISIKVKVFYSRRLQTEGCFLGG